MPRSTLAVLGSLLWACGSPPSDRLPVSNFSGLTWHVKDYQETPVEPGPNLFSSSLENAWVDSNGFLHLRISERAGRWYCAEVFTDRLFGYGTYVFTLGSSGVALDVNSVLGLFTWDDPFDASQVNPHREIDLEFSRWGNPLWADFQFVVQPFSLSPDNVHRFEVDDSLDPDTVHAFTWGPSGITFTSAHGSTYPPPESMVIERWTYGGAANPSPSQVQVNINLWLFSGAPPGSGDAQEMIVKRFEFIPP